VTDDTRSRRTMLLFTSGLLGQIVVISCRLMRTSVYVDIRLQSERTIVDDVMTIQMEMAETICASTLNHHFDLNVTLTFDSLTSNSYRYARD